MRARGTDYRARRTQDGGAEADGPGEGTEEGEEGGDGTEEGEEGGEGTEEEEEGGEGTEEGEEEGTAADGALALPKARAPACLCACMPARACWPLC